MPLRNWIPGSAKRKAASAAAKTAASASEFPLSTAVAVVETPSGIVRVNRKRGNVIVNFNRRPLRIPRNLVLSEEIEMHTNLPVVPNMEWAIWMLENSLTINLCIKNLPVIMKLIEGSASLLMSKAVAPLIASRRGNGVMKRQLQDINRALSVMRVNTLFGRQRAGRRTNINAVEWVKFVTTGRNLRYDFDDVKQMVDDSKERRIKTEKWTKVTGQFLSMVFNLVTVFNIVSIYTGEMGSLINSQTNIAGGNVGTTAAAVEKLRRHLTNTLAIFYRMIPGAYIVLVQVLPQFCSSAIAVGQAFGAPQQIVGPTGPLQRMMAGEAYDIRALALMFPFEWLIQRFPPEALQKILFKGLESLELNLVDLNRQWAEQVRSSVTREIFNVSEMAARGMTDEQIKTHINKVTAGAYQLFAGTTLEARREAVDRVNTLYREMINGISTLRTTGQGYILKAMIAYTSIKLLQIGATKSYYNSRLEALPARTSRRRALPRGIPNVLTRGPHAGERVSRWTRQLEEVNEARRTAEENAYRRQTN